MARTDVYKTDGDGIEIIDVEAGGFEVMFSRDDFIAGATLVWDVQITATDGSVSTLDFATEARTSRSNTACS